MKKLVLIALTLNLASCAYFERKACEDINWFQHGEKVAMSGRLLENDDQLRRCRKVEADIDEGGLDRGFKKGRSTYCEPETAFATGKKGEPFASSMCDGGNLQTLKKRHADGIRDYCDPSNGETAGASGGEYKKVCPKNMEAAFLREFNKGRKKYLAAEISSREQQVEDMDDEIRRLQDERQRKSYELASIGGTKVISRERVNTIYGSQTRDQITTVDDPQTQSRRDSVKREIDDLDWQIRNKRDGQGRVKEEMRKLKSEMMAL